MLYQVFVVSYLLVCAYKTYVTPLVESILVIWSPSALGDTEIHVIEHLQRNFTKILAGLQSLPYTERLKRLDLDSLDLRRSRADLVWCYKIIFGLVCLDVKTPFTRYNRLSNRLYRLYNRFDKHGLTTG